MLQPQLPKGCDFSYRKVALIITKRMHLPLSKGCNSATERLQLYYQKVATLLPKGCNFNYQNATPTTENCNSNAKSCNSNYQKVATLIPKIATLITKKLQLSLPKGCMFNYRKVAPLLP